MKKYSILLFFLLLINLGFGQSKEIDSLKGVISTSKIKANRATAFERLGWLHIQRDTKKAKVYLDSSKALYTYLQDDKNLSQLQYKFGVLDRFLGNYDAAIVKFNIYIKHCENIKDSINVTNTLYQKGVTYSLMGDYKKALEVQFKTLKMYEDIDMTSSGVAFTLNSVGNSFKNLKLFKKAEGYYLRAVAINEKNRDIENLADSYSSLGSLYSDMQQYKKGLNYFKKCLTLDSKSNNQWAIASDYQNIGIANYHMRDYQLAIKNLNHALEIQEINNYKSDMIFVMSKLGSTYLKLKKFDKSEALFKKALGLESGSLQTDQEINRELKSLFKIKGNYKEAFYYFKEEERIKDNIFKIDNLKSINELNLKYQTEKKDKEIAEQQLQLEQHKTQLQKNKIQYSYMTGALLLLLVTSVLLWFLYQQRQKRKNQEILTLKREHQVQTLESLMEGEEKERFRIAKELHDGVNGDLSAIKFKLSSLLEMNNTVIKEAVTMIDKSCQQVRAISHNLIPPSLQDFNLIEALEEYCTNMNAIHSPNITFQQLGDAIILTKKQEANIFRIVQELVNNSIKHAESNKIDVQISSRKGVIQVTVEDNGKGYNKQHMNTDGIGLKNIQSRVNYLNATLDLVSNTWGTSSTIELEINKLNKN